MRFICFIFPIPGIIFGMAEKNVRPEKARTYLRSAAWGFIFYNIFWIILFAVFYLGTFLGIFPEIYRIIGQLKY